MSRRSDQIAGIAEPPPEESLVKENATALRSVFDTNADELLWVAEVMSGNRQVAEQCISEAIELADSARCTEREWILPWIKRLLVHVVLKSIGGEIRPLLLPGRSQRPTRVARFDLSASERQRLRGISPQEIIASCDGLERVCFILFLYLQYPLIDCALLLGCPRTWIEPICDDALTRCIEAGLFSPDRIQDIGSSHLPGAMACQAG